LGIFHEISNIIRASAQRCQNTDAEMVDDELSYTDELLGISFVLLQTKIRRVSELARDFKISPTEINILGHGDNYKCTDESLIRLVWEVANYYKHSDDWSREVWEEKPDGAKLNKSERTCKIVQKVGIDRSFTARNVTTAYEFFGIDWASDCTPLANKVQEWAKAVYDKCSEKAA
jgi:hypothetical protein